MLDQPQIILNPQADRRLKKGHLWIYSNEIDTQKTPLKNFSAGQLVLVSSSKGQVLGRAFINPNALICGRLLTRLVDAPINKGFFKHLIGQALSLREQCFPQPYYRLVYGDADFIPGLVIDRYGDHLVIQISVAGLELLLEPLLEACQELLRPKGIVIKNNHSARELEDLSGSLQIIGDVPEMLTLIENQTQFQVSATAGQKTGWFYDHRVNRSFLQGLVKGKSVLDVFSYVGGWGIEAAQAGASNVLCVDASEAAVAGVLHNAKLNQLASVVSAERGKAVDMLKTLVAEKSRFDVVILDPPAFIKKRKDQRAGEAAYRHLNELAIRLLGQEGLLVSASCSMPLSSEGLREIVRGAARHVDRNAQLIFNGSHAPDHPVHPAIPETEYLKAQFYRITSD